MFKKMMVLAGMAAMLLCGCGSIKDTTVEVKTELEANVDKLVETSEELVDDISTAIADMYTAVIYEIFGEDLDDSKLTCNDYGIYYEDKFVSWEYIDTYAYNSMKNEWS